MKKYFAELDTDRIIREKYFSDFSYKGIMVEVGGATPEYISMSRHFKLNDWRCIIVEPNPKFAQLHREIGNEVFEFACSDSNIDSADFQIAHVHSNPSSHDTLNDDHSFSSIKIKKEYTDKHSILSLPVTTIKVGIRKLDTILKLANVNALDFVSIDVEGWEIEVMKGFSANIYRPKVILLENYLDLPQYTAYMKEIGYKLDMQISYNHIFTRQD